MLLKKLLLFFALLAFTNEVIAQQFRKMEFKPYQKQWEDGPVTVADFQGEPVANASVSTSLSYQLGYYPEKLKRNDSTIYRFAAYSFMDRNKSWLKAGGNQQQALQYNQALLNLVEIHERQLQQQLNRLNNQFEAEQVTSQAFKQLEIEAEAFASQTKYGQDAAAVRQYLATTEARLAATRKEVVPPVNVRNFNYGMHFGIGYTVPTGSLGNYFQNPKDLVYGFDLGYKKTILLLNATLGFSQTKKSFEYFGFWSDDLPITMAMIETSLGYRIVDNSKIRLTPFAGWALIEFSPNNRVEVYRNRRLVERTFSAGLAFDYKMRHRLALIPSFLGGREVSESSIRTRLTFSPVSYNDFQKGTIINLSAEFNLVGSLLKRE